MAEDKKRIKPDIFIATLLDDIRHEMVQNAKLAKKAIDLTQSMIEEGVVEPLQPKTITTERTHVFPPDPDKPWFGVKVTNDGPATVHLLINTKKSMGSEELKADETFGVQFKTAIIKDLLLHTESGTAVVRIRGKR